MDGLCRRGTAGVAGDTGLERESSLYAREMNSERYFVVAEKAPVLFLHLDMRIVKIVRSKVSIKMNVWLKMR